MGLFRPDVSVWRVGGQALRGREGGPPNGQPPVLMLHGLGADLDEFVFVWPELVRERHCLAYDHPGFGPLGEDLGGAAIAAMADMAARVIHHKADGGPVDVLAASMGGMVAVNLMARYPRLVRRAVLVAPAGGWPALGPAAALMMLAGAMAPFPPVQILTTLSMYLGHQRNPVPPGQPPADWQRAFFDFHRRLDQPAHTRHMLDTLSRLLGESALPWARRVTHPVRILWGTADATIPYLLARPYADTFGRAELKTLPGADHNLTTRNHPVVTRETRDFLTG